MHIAIATFNDRVAPRAEGAPEVCMVDLDDPQGEPGVGPGSSVGLGPWLDALEGAGVQWVLCGAMSPFLLSALGARGIQVMMGVAGEVDAVVEALRDGRLKLGGSAAFSVWPAGGPGPGRCFGLGPFGFRRRFGQGGRRGRGFGPPGPLGRRAFKGRQP